MDAVLHVTILSIKNNPFYQSSKYQLKLAAAIDCEWNDWELGMCSKPCGGGTRTNTRTKKSEEENGGKCEGENTVEEPCNAQSCPGKSLIG